MVFTDPRDQRRGGHGVDPAPQLRQSAEQGRVRDEGVLAVQGGQGLGVDLAADAQDVWVDGGFLAQGGRGAGRRDDEEERVDVVPDLAGEGEEGGFGCGHGRVCRFGRGT